MACASSLLVGDEPYYARFGFHPVPPGQIVLPGPVDPNRLLAAELAPDALGGFQRVRRRATRGMTAAGAARKVAADT